MKRFTPLSMVSVFLALVIALPFYAQQAPSPGTPTETRPGESSTSPNVQQPSDRNSTTTQQDPGTSPYSGTTTQSGPLSSDNTRTATTTAAPNWILAIISLAIGMGIGYLIGRRRPDDMRSRTGGAGMASPGRA